MEDFINHYHGYKFDDDVSFTSQDFQEFERYFAEYVESDLSIGYHVVNHNCGHYDLFGFVEGPACCIYKMLHGKAQVL